MEREREREGGGTGGGDVRNCCVQIFTQNQARLYFYIYFVITLSQRQRVYFIHGSLWGYSIRSTCHSPPEECNLLVEWHLKTSIENKCPFNWDTVFCLEYMLEVVLCDHSCSYLCKIYVQQGTIQLKKNNLVLGNLYSVPIAYLHSMVLLRKHRGLSKHSILVKILLLWTGIPSISCCVCLTSFSNRL